MDYVIIVAGGSSRRFGSDKLLTNVGGDPVVRRVLEASSGLGEQVVVTSRPEAERLGALAGGARLLLDNEGLPCGGPPRAVASAISSLEGEGRALILPGDAAWASAAGLRRLISYCSSRLASPLTSGGYVASAFICGPLGLLRRASELMCAKASAGGTARMTDLVRASLLGGQALGLTH